MKKGITVEVSITHSLKTWLSFRAGYELRHIFNLSVRTINLFNRAEIENLGELLSHTREELTKTGLEPRGHKNKVTKFGPKSIAEIDVMLHKLGLKLKK